MKPELQKQSSDTKSEGRRSITKYLAVATMAASLGVSLGVPVVDALAADGPGSPPAYSKQGKFKSQTDQEKVRGSKQYKESNQLKLQQKQSNQLKLKQDVGTTAGQGQVNK